MNDFQRRKLLRNGASIFLSAYAPKRNIDKREAVDRRAEEFYGERFARP